MKVTSTKRTEICAEYMIKRLKEFRIPVAELISAGTWFPHTFYKTNLML
jgi:hypothetical protein